MNMQDSAAVLLRTVCNSIHYSAVLQTSVAGRRSALHGEAI